MRIMDWSSDVCSSDLIITMKGAEIINNGSIVIRNGRITDIGPSSIVDTPQDSIVRDMSGMTIMPGMIDMHAHITQPKNVVVNPRWEFISYIAHGVTSIRDPQTGRAQVRTTFHNAHLVTR